MRPPTLPPTARLLQVPPLSQLDILHLKLNLIVKVLLQQHGEDGYLGTSMQLPFYLIVPPLEELDLVLRAGRERSPDHTMNIQETVLLVQEYLLFILLLTQVLKEMLIGVDQWLDGDFHGNGIIVVQVVLL